MLYNTLFNVDTFSTNSKISDTPQNTIQTDWNQNIRYKNLNSDSNDHKLFEIYS